MDSIMKNDKTKFSTLSEINDLNFSINKDGMFPLLIVAALGKYLLLLTCSDLISYKLC